MVIFTVIILFWICQASQFFFGEICKTFREMETLFVQDVDKVNNCQNYMYKTSHIFVDTDSTVQVMKPCTTD